MTGRALVEGTREHRLANRDHRHAEGLARLLQDLLATAKWKRRQIVFAGRKNLQPVVVSADADGLLDAFVVGREFVVTDRPVVLDATQRAFAKVRRRVAQHHRVPVQRAATQDADAIDPNTAVGILETYGAFQIRRIERLLLFAAKAAELHIVGPAMRAELTGIHLLTRFEQDDLGARLAKLLSHHTAGRAGTDHAGVVGNAHAICLFRNFTPSKAMDSGVGAMSRQIDAAAESSPSAKPKLSMVSQRS